MPARFGHFAAGSCATGATSLAGVSGDRRRSSCRRVAGRRVRPVAGQSQRVWCPGSGHARFRDDCKCASSRGRDARVSSQGGRVGRPDRHARFLCESERVCGRRRVARSPIPRSSSSARARSSSGACFRAWPRSPASTTPSGRACRSRRPPRTATTWCASQTVGLPGEERWQSISSALNSRYTRNGWASRSFRRSISCGLGVALRAPVEFLLVGYQALDAVEESCELRHRLRTWSSAPVPLV
jgi:hypothetical protein